MLLLTGCGDSPKASADAPGSDAPATVEAEPLADPVALARAWLTNDVFADTTEMMFAPGLDRGDFPARLMVDRPQEYRFIDIWRVRTVDQRVLIDALVQLAGEPHVVAFWMEQASGVWRIAGWRAQTRPGVKDRADFGGVDLPSVLAASAFRGAPPARFVPVMMDEGISAESGKSKVRVGFKAFKYEGDCPKSKVASQLRRQRRRLARCHADALGDEVRPGRLTFAVEITPRTVDANIVEATLVAGALTDCVEAALERIKVRRVQACTVQVPITFTPKTR
jgi:hypothetical protein